VHVLIEDETMDNVCNDLDEYGEDKDYNSCNHTFVSTEYDRMGTRPIPTAFYDMIGTFKSLSQNEYSFHVRNNGWPPFRKRLWAQQWVVYCKPPYGSPEKVLDYLGRYVHRVAISNNRLVALKEGAITFSYRDRSDHNQLKQVTVPCQEFIRRFLCHVLPKDFMRIRSYGFLANRCKKKDLETIRSLLGTKAPPPQQNQSWQDIMKELTGQDMTLCPCCQHGSMSVIERIEPRPRGSMAEVCRLVTTDHSETEIKDTS